MSMFSRFLKDESGATAIEYALIAALMAAAIITALGSSGIGGSLSASFKSISDALTANKV